MSGAIFLIADNGEFAELKKHGQTLQGRQTWFPGGFIIRDS